MPPSKRYSTPAKPVAPVRTQSNERSPPASTRRHEVDGIGLSLWIRTDADESFLRVDFPTAAGSRGDVFVSRGLRRRPADILRKIEDAGGELPWPNPTEKLGSLMMIKDLQPHFLTPTSGWHRGAFVPAVGRTETSDNNGRSCAIRVRFDMGRSPFGLRRGSAEAWHATVGALARQSTMLSFSVMVALAASLAEHAGLAEGVLFNMFADSSNGKTTCLRVAMSVAGDPQQIESYHASPRGMEEAAALSNGYPMLVDDMEKISDDPKKVFQHVQHIITGGKSKRTAQITKDQLPPLEWTCFGLSTSPRSMAEMMQRAGKTPSLGDRVRFPDIPFPVGDRGGLFDLDGTGSPPNLRETQARLNQIEQGMKANFGNVFEEWRKKVLGQLTSDDISTMVDDATRRVRQANGVEGRLIRKIAVVKVAGELAIRHGILPWPKTHPGAVVGRVWNWARQELRSEHTIGVKPWLALKAALGDETLVVRLEADQPFQGDLNDLVGIRRKRNGVEVVALLPDKLREALGGEFNDLIKALRAKGAIQTAPRQPSNMTAQIPILFADTNKRSRQRFYVVRADILAAFVAAKSKVAVGLEPACFGQSKEVGQAPPRAARPTARAAPPRRSPTAPSPAAQAKTPPSRHGR